MSEKHNELKTYPCERVREGVAQGSSSRDYSTRTGDTVPHEIWGTARIEQQRQGLDSLPKEEIRLSAQRRALTANFIAQLNNGAQLCCLNHTSG